MSVIYSKLLPKIVIHMYIANTCVYWSYDKEKAVIKRGSRCCCLDAPPRCSTVSRCSCFSDHPRAYNLTPREEMALHQRSVASNQSWQFQWKMTCETGLSKCKGVAILSTVTESSSKVIKCSTRCLGTQGPSVTLVVDGLIGILQDNQFWACALLKL